MPRNDPPGEKAAAVEIVWSESLDAALVWVTGRNWPNLSKSFPRNGSSSSRSSTRENELKQAETLPPAAITHPPVAVENAKVPTASELRHQITAPHDELDYDSIPPPPPPVSFDLDEETATSPPPPPPPLSLPVLVFEEECQDIDGKSHSRKSLWVPYDFVEKRSRTCIFDERLWRCMIILFIVALVGVVCGAVAFACTAGLRH